MFEWFWRKIEQIVNRCRPALPDDPIGGIPKIWFVVGHEQSAQGAVGADGKSEYEFIKPLLKEVVSKTEATGVSLRDGTNIAGAIDRAYRAGADIVVEVHRNAYNGKAHGTEALSASANNELARQFLKLWSQRARLTNRGIKVRAQRQAGGTSVHRIAATVGRGFLWEMYFGDNVKDIRSHDEVVSFLVDWVNKVQGK